MPDMTGTFLIHAGLVRPGAVKEARALAARSGATLGECLIALGAVDEEQLAELYHRRLMIPRLDERRLSNVAPAVLRLVPADMAVEFRVVPVGIAEGNLLLAMSDPSDNHAVDEIGFFADHFVLRHGATESAIHGAIERLYGVRLPVAIAPVILSRPKIEPLPPVVLEVEDLTPPPGPLPHEPDSVHVDMADEPVLLTNVKRNEPGTDEEPILLTKPTGSAPAPVDSAATRERDTLPQFPAVALPDPPLGRLRGAADRDSIARALLDYFSQLASRTVLLIAQKEMLTAKEGRNMDPEVVRQLTVSLRTSSLFRDVVASRLPYRGPLPSAAGDRAFAHAVGGVQGEVLIMPIAVRDRIVAVIYADGTRPPLPDAALHATTREAGLAYERIILKAKIH